jgi:hypothetical protein
LRSLTICDSGARCSNRSTRLCWWCCCDQRRQKPIERLDQGKHQRQLSLAATRDDADGEPKRKPVRAVDEKIPFLMTGRTVRIPGLRFDKTGKLVRDGRRLSVSARLRQNGSSACGSSAEASLTDATVVRRTTKRPPASVSIAELNETTGVRPCVACGERPRLARCSDARRACRPTPRATASSPRRRWGSRRRRSSVAPARRRVALSWR